MKNPKVSIIIPTFNRKEKLIETVESVESNDWSKKNFEIIIINDKSTDNTSEVISNLQKKFSNILYLENKQNLGPAKTRNRGIKKTKGNLIFFTDDDCLVPKDWIQKYVKFFSEHKEVYCAGGILEAKEKNIFSILENIKDKILGIKNKNTKIGNKEIKTGFTNNCVYRKKAFEKVGIFKENFKVPAGEDLEMSQRVAKNYKIAFVPIKVLHNHKYNLDYFSGLIFKQVLGIMPPKKFKISKLIINLPKIIFIIIKKIFNYRK
jgi:glycosyltransferase involved in cell wall biosynthesis